MKKSLFVLALILVLLSFSVLADGGFFVDAYRNEDIYEPSQKAVIFFNQTDASEQLILQASYKGNVSDFAWVVPVPSYPNVTTTFNRIFDILHDLTKPKYIRSPSSIQTFGTGSNYETDVTVYEQKQVGIYETAVLSSEDPKALLKWLNDHNYKVSSKAESVLDYYVQNKWYFVALRINSVYLGYEQLQEDLNSGTIYPISITFSTDSMVYPLKISSINKGTSEILLYVISNSRTKIEGFSGLFFNVEYANWIQGNQFYPAFYFEEIFSKMYLSHNNYFITKFRGKMPTALMTSDLKVVPAKNNDEYRMTTYNFKEWAISILFIAFIFIIPIAVIVGIINIIRRIFFKRDKKE